MGREIKVTEKGNEGRGRNVRQKGAGDVVGKEEEEEKKKKGNEEKKMRKG